MEYENFSIEDDENGFFYEPDACMQYSDIFDVKSNHANQIKEQPNFE